MLRAATDGLIGANSDEVGAAAVDYLRLFALVSMGWMWTRMAVAAATGDGPLHRAKLKVAHFFSERMLCEAPGLAASISAGAAPIMALAADAF